MRSLLAAFFPVILLAGCASSNATVMRLGEADRVYVCHGKKNAHWIQIAEPAVEAHRRHGDVVVVSRRMPLVRCGK